MDDKYGMDSQDARNGDRRIIGPDIMSVQVKKTYFEGNQGKHGLQNTDRSQNYLRRHDSC